MPSYNLNFRALTNPNWNELQANTFGASTVMSGNTPYEHYLYSLYAQSLFQQPGNNRITSPREWERIIRENQSPVSQNESTEETEKENPCGFMDYKCQVGKALKSEPVSDFFKNSGLVLLGAVLLIIGIISLR